MSTFTETHTFKKTIHPKTIRLPLLGNHDCYMQITITENHDALCNHIERNLDSYPVVANAPEASDNKKKGDKQVSKSVEPNTAAESINVSELLPTGDIGKLSDILNKMIRSNVIRVDGDIADHSHCSCSEHVCACQNKVSTPKSAEVEASVPPEVEEAPDNEINVRTEEVQSKPNKTAEEKSIGDVTQHTQCSCSSPECSCVNSRVASKHNSSNLPKPISSLNNKGSMESRRQRPHQVSDSKIQTVTNYDDFTNPHFINDRDLPLEGYNYNQQQLAKQNQQNEISEIATELYNPEERDKKLRLLRLLIQEALPKNSVPIVSKTIEIPHSGGLDLKKTDSLIIRIIVEKEIKD